jgi:hypothetical protein
MGGRRGREDEVICADSWAVELRSEPGRERKRVRGVGSEEDGLLQSTLEPLGVCVLAALCYGGQTSHLEGSEPSSLHHDADLVWGRAAESTDAEESVPGRVLEEEVLLKGLGRRQGDEEEGRGQHEKCLSRLE